MSLPRGMCNGLYGHSAVCARDEIVENQGSVKQHVELEQRQRGFDEATYVESFLVLNALGGDCLEDWERLRVALPDMWNFTLNKGGR